MRTMPVLRALLCASLLLRPTSCGKLYEAPPTIYDAAAAGTHEVLRELMQAGADANAPDASGRMPLHLAAAAGHVTTCWVLLATPWDLTDDFPVTNRVLLERAESEAQRRAGGGQDGGGVQGHLPLSLYHNPLDADSIRYTWTPEGHLVRSRMAREDAYQGTETPEAVDRWRGPRAEINAGTANVSDVYGDERRHKFNSLAGETALHLASQWGRSEVVKLLLSNVSGQVVDVDQPSVANINKGVGMGETALHYAAKYGKTTAARFLLDAGASVDPLTTQGWTPLHYAAKEGYMDVITLLVQRGADLSAVTRQGVRALSLSLAPCNRWASLVGRAVLRCATASLTSRHRPAVVLPLLFGADCNHT
jgi:ankyrin